jgi:hypothetical protein
MDDLPPLTAAIAQNPDDGSRWLALAAWYTDRGRVDEGDAIRVLWRTLRDIGRKQGKSVGVVLADVADHAGILGQAAREVERRAREGPDDGWRTG